MRAFVIAAAAVTAVMAPWLQAQSPTFGLGRTPTPDELKAIDISVLPGGTGLPPGNGTAKAGKPIFDARCVTCHGATAREGPQDVLVGGQGTLATLKPLKTIGSYWPRATTLWDYVNRAMPFDHPGTLPANDVYSVTAYLLYLNGIVGESDVLDASSLPRVKMPNRDGFVPDSRPDTGTSANKKTKNPL